MNKFPEVRILRHKLYDGNVFYSIGRVDSLGYTTEQVWESSPEELQRLINEAFQKEPVNFKVERFSGK